MRSSSREGACGATCILRSASDQRAQGCEDTAAPRSRSPLSSLSRDLQTLGKGRFPGVLKLSCSCRQGEWETEPRSVCPGKWDTQSTSVIIREMQTKATVRYHLTADRMALISKSAKECWLARMWRKGNPSAVLVGLQTGAATVENSMEFPQKKGPSDSPSGNLSEETQNINLKE